MRVRHVLYVGTPLAGCGTSLAVLCPRRGPDDEWEERLAAGVEVGLAAGVERVRIVWLTTRSLWFPSYRAARDSGQWRLRELVERAAAFLPVLDGVVFVAESQRVRMEANLESLERVLEFLCDEGVDPAGVPFVFQLNKQDIPGVLGVDELRGVLATPRCAYVESIAVRGLGVHEALATLLALRDAG